MNRIDENDLANAACNREGGCKQVDIAQTKDVMKAVLDELADEWAKGNEAGVVELMTRHKASC